MSDMIEVTIALFGAFHACAAGSAVQLSLPAGSTVGALRARFAGELERRCPDLAGSRLIAVSVFADETKILDEAAVLADGAALAILPPVCGG